MLFTRERVIEAAARATFRNDAMRKDASSRSLREAMTKAAATDTFDVFLSHARADEDVVYGTKLELESYGFSVYVDWIDDPQLDRSHVTRKTALALRRRMRQCRSLLYLHTENSSHSKWMPWELGYFDGRAGRVAILPVVEDDAEEFTGVEYVGIYPYLDEMENKRGTLRLWVNRPGSRTVYAPLGAWLDDVSELQERTPW